MSIQNEAIARITEECEDKPYLIPIEEFLTNLCITDTIATKILNPDKTLEGAFLEIKKVAQSRAVKGFAFVPEHEGFEIVKKYYKINSNEEEQQEAKDEIKDNVIDIMDLL